MRKRARTTSTSDRSSRACLDWLRAHAISFDPTRGPSIRALKALGPLLQGKRVAMLSETVQQVRETSVFRLALLRFLAGQGFNLIGAPASWSDGARIHRFLTTNTLAELDRVALLGYRGSARTDRDDSRTGSATGSSATGSSATGSIDTTANRAQESATSRAARLRWQSEHQAAVCKEQRRFYIALRKLREKQKPPHGPISLFGYDADGSLGDCYEEIDVLLRARRQPRIDTLRQLLARVHGEDMAAEINASRGRSTGWTCSTRAWPTSWAAAASHMYGISWRCCTTALSWRALPGTQTTLIASPRAPHCAIPSCTPTWHTRWPNIIPNPKPC